MRLRILFLEPQPCIRALKYARGLEAALGDTIVIISNTTKIFLANDIVKVNVTT